MPFKPYVAALLILDPGMTAMGCARTAWAAADETPAESEQMDPADLWARGEAALARMEAVLATINRRT